MLSAHDLLMISTRALLARVNGVRLFTETIPAVAGAAAPRDVLVAIEMFLLQERDKLIRRINHFLAWLRSPAGQRATPENRQQKFAILKLVFNTTLDDVDLFSDALVQRSEHGTGIWLAGLDVLARDAQTLSGRIKDVPPLLTYVDRGHGAAIRRARTRLPGGGENPVAVIRVPRERLVGCGVASSLLHEVGHQAADQWSLLTPLRTVLERREQQQPAHRIAWQLWRRWIGEVISDLWAVSRLGAGAILGLYGYASLPKAFVVRIVWDDPHPFPWVRFLLTTRMGQALYPDPQWRHLEDAWRQLNPLGALSAYKAGVVRSVLQTMPDFIRLLLQHRVRAAGNLPLGALLMGTERTPTRLRELIRTTRLQLPHLCQLSPTLAMAVLGQASLERALPPEREGNLLSRLLRTWALRQALPVSGHVMACNRLAETAACA